MEASHVYIRRGGAIPPLAPLYTGPYKVLAMAGQFFQVGDWLPLGDCVSGPLEVSSGARSSSVGRSPGPWTAASRRTGIQTVTPQLGAVFSGTSARFFAHPRWSTMASSLGGGGMWGPTFNVVQVVILLWCDFICVKIPQ
jgi:hypothetical protein